MSSSIIRAAAVAVAALSFIGQANAIYNMETEMVGSTFFDNFDFFTGPDPTHGFVNYQSRADAGANSLIGFNAPYNRNFMGADKTQVNPVGGRKSVRIESKKTWTKGLFVLDLVHAPEEACGVWPAFWTVNKVDSYPRWGEIDIFESINQETKSLNVLHTSPGCTISGAPNIMTGNVTTNNCDDLSNYNAGCASIAPGAYGSQFNANGGGVIVMEWTTNFIKMWNFPRNAVPANIGTAHPDTASWGLPHFSTQGGSCVMDDHFKNHKVVFDITFCGDYAGQDQFWKKTSCAAKYATCTEYVAANPQAFQNAYWIINSLRIYKWT